ncbi:hypothetical protein DEO72_LG3g672 [Vigna unguiculata]|uniref:Uncharacterized protein n=1 Tax=Vigna unguiculata TaxID=3917 RepID=A0A4D6LC45_VIGUN|nr:hypothetical protein DEO72_LG3g672 [Vigna unguiculata]
MDVGNPISHDITYTADMENVKLGFPALITALCKDRGILSDTHVLFSLQPPVDKKFIRKNCINKVELNELAPAPRAPRPPRATTSSHFTHDPSSTFKATFQAAMTKMFARQEDMWLGHQAIRQGQVSIMDSMHKLSLGGLSGAEEGGQEDPDAEEGEQRGQEDPYAVGST